MEPDESLGEDARSIAYFDMYVYVSPTCPASVSGSSCILSLQDAELITVTKFVFVVGFCSERVKETYLRYDTRRCRRMTTTRTMTEMMLR
jgi:hypothetical protein